MSRNPAGPMAVRTSNEAYYRHVSAEAPLDNAVAHVSEEHPELAECNLVSDVLIEELQAAPEAVYAAVQAYFAERGAACHRWIPALQQPVETLEALLAPRGYVREETVALLRPPGPTAEADPRVAMLPARAMRRACRAVLASRFAEWAGGSFSDRSCCAEAGEDRSETGPPIRSPVRSPIRSPIRPPLRPPNRETVDRRVEVHLQRLNDPQYDALVAMRDERPAGFVAVHQVGEIGRIRDVYVMPEHRRGGVARAMLHYAVATAQRWLLRPICAQVSAEDAAGRALFGQLGFEEAGPLVRFRLAETAPEMVL